MLLATSLIPVGNVAALGLSVRTSRPLHSTNAVRDALSAASAPILKLKANLPFFKTVLMSYSIDDTLAPTTASGHVPVLLRETLELFAQVEALSF